MKANILPTDSYPPPPQTRTPPWGQIKKNQECSNMVTNILPADTPDPEDGVNMSKFIFSSEHGHVAYQFYGNHEMQQHGSRYFSNRPQHPLPPTHTHRPWGWGQIKKNQECSNMVAHILPGYTPDPGDSVNMSKFNFFRI